jgi:hypothetical protein
MLVVDLMHEFELGVWKTLFTHLIRLLYAAGNGTDRLVLELDRRYAQALPGSLGSANLCSFSIKISPNTYLWPWNDPSLSFECLRNEKVGCTRLRGHSSGKDHFQPLT